jgi:hypothetical protein
VCFKPQRTAKYHICSAIKCCLMADKVMFAQLLFHINIIELIVLLYYALKSQYTCVRKQNYQSPGRHHSDISDTFLFLCYLLLIIHCNFNIIVILWVLSDVGMLTWHFYKGKLTRLTIFWYGYHNYFSTWENRGILSRRDFGGQTVFLHRGSFDLTWEWDILSDKFMQI